jgi:hypothetical protein
MAAMMDRVTWEQTGTLYGAGGALFLMASFGIGWAMTMVTNWTTPLTITLAVGFIALVVGFSVVGVLTLRALRNFGLLFAAEAVLMAAAVGVCLDTGHYEFAAPLVVLIMGAHFILFAPVYHRRFDYLPGILAVLVGLGGIVAVAHGGDPIRVIAVMGLGGASCTTMYGLYDSWVIRRACAD